MEDEEQVPSLEEYMKKWEQTHARRWYELEKLMYGYKSMFGEDGLKEEGEGEGWNFVDKSIRGEVRRMCMFCKPPHMRGGTCRIMRCNPAEFLVTSITAENYTMPLVVCSRCAVEMKEMRKTLETERENFYARIQNWLLPHLQEVGDLLNIVQSFAYLPKVRQTGS